MLAILHVLSLLFLYLMLVSIFPFTTPLPAVFVSLLCSVFAVGISAGKMTSLKKSLSCMIALCPCLLIRDAAGAVYLLLPAGYLLLLIIMDRLDTENWAFRTHFLWTLPVEAVFFLLAYGSVRNASVTMTTAMLAFLTGVAYLRLSRLGSTDLRYRALDLAAVGSVMLISLVPAFVISALLGMLPAFWEAILMPFGALLGLLVTLLAKIMPAPYQDETLPPATEAIETVAGSEERPFLPYGEELELEKGLPNLMPYILIVVAAVLLTLAFWYLVRRIQSLHRRTVPVQEKGEVTAFVPEPPQKEQQEQNRKKIRRLYVRYLNLLTEHGYLRKSKDTSQDIYDVTGWYTADDANDRFRAYYIKARYDTVEPVTDQEVKEAKKAYAVLKSVLRASKETQ